MQHPWNRWVNLLGYIINFSSSHWYTIHVSKRDEMGAPILFELIDSRADIIIENIPPTNLAKEIKKHHSVDISSSNITITCVNISGEADPTYLQQIFADAWEDESKGGLSIQQQNYLIKSMTELTDIRSITNIYNTRATLIAISDQWRQALGMNIPNDDNIISSIIMNEPLQEMPIDRSREEDQWQTRRQGCFGCFRF